MATVDTQRPLDPTNPLDRWRQDVDRRIFIESDEFVKDALNTLRDSANVDRFTNNVALVADKANEIDEAFDRVTREFTNIVNNYGKDFPGISRYYDDWKSYQDRWMKAFWESRDVASSHATILKRLKDVFLPMALAVTTDEELKDAKEALKGFSEEYHPTGHQISEEFKELKRDVAYFIGRLDQFVQDTGTKLMEEAKNLLDSIHILGLEIESLDAKIANLKIGLAIAGGLLFVIGMLGINAALRNAQNERIAKYKELGERQRDLEEVNRKQGVLAFLKTDLAGLHPDINLVSANIVLFAEIWLQVQSISKQILDQMNAGLGATNEDTFVAEIELVQLSCIPFIDGLEQYATQVHRRTVD